LALETVATILFIDTGVATTSRLVFYNNAVQGFPTTPAAGSDATIYPAGYLFDLTGGGSGGTIAWSTITGTPTTLAGYGITDAQPLDTDLTAIAALATTAFGRGILTQTDGAAIRTYIGASTSSFDGNYNSLSNIPTTFTPSSHNQPWSTITSTPTTLAGYGITDAQAFITAGTTAQYYRGDKTFQTLDKAAVGLALVENTALTTWTGSSFITTLGTIVTGTWNGTAIGDTYISSASVWNAKQNAIGFTPENVGNKATSLTSPDNTKYPTTLAISTALAGKSDTSHTHLLSAIINVTATATEINYSAGVTSAIQTQLNAKQATLVSATNIKTINGQSVLGAGDLAISGGGVTAHNALTGINADDHTQYSLANGSRWTATPTANRVVISDASGNIIVSSITTTLLGYLGSVSSDIQTQLNSKQSTLVSATNIKTVNGQTLLGSGDVTISGGVAWGNVTGTLSNQTDLQTALNGKSNTGHGHGINDISGLQTALDGKATTASVTTVSTDLASLTTVVAGKQNTLGFTPENTTNKSASLTSPNDVNFPTTKAVSDALAGKSNTLHTHLLTAITDVTVTATEINYLTGVSSSVQTQLNSKQSTITNSDAITQGTTNLFLLSSERTKLTGIQAGAEVNVNADWNAVLGDAQILNKPTTLAGYGITDSQPLDTDLTAIAALTTTSFGRGILTQADGAAIRTYIGAGTSSFDGNYNSLSNIPTTFTPSSHNQAWSTITGTPTTLSGYGITEVTKAMVGLSLVDNTSDANKPISAATQTALDLKNKVITSGTAAPSGGSDGDIYLQYT
jgi:hypothetical protein